jgi:sulfur-oxidizing protein SoxB
MIGRRHFVQASAAAALLACGAPLGRLAAQQALTQRDLLAFEPTGQVTLLHFTDIHAQMMPVHFREPSMNVGVGAVAGLPPHLTGRHLLAHYGIRSGSADAFALSSEDFAALARTYGRMGGLDRMATLVKAIRAERPGRVLLLDGGDTWQGSYAANATRGADMVEAMHALGVDAMTAHWEFTYGAERVKALKDQLRFPFLCGNVKEEPFGDAVFDAGATFERGGLKITVIGQAFPYTPIANPRWMIPDWSFGIEEDRLRERVEAARADGADLVVLLSHNGFDVDRKLAARVRGIDVILTGHTHDALPAPEIVDGTLLIASGSHGKFLSRLDLDVRGRRVAGWRYRLIPIFSDAVAPDPEMASLVARLRAPHAPVLDRVLGRTDDLLYRRGNLAGTFDDLICEALRIERDAEIVLSPGFRWGVSLLPGSEIRAEDLHSQTAITYPQVYRSRMSGQMLKDILEDVADNLFNPDPYLQQGGDMVRVGGMSYALDVAQPIGRRISEMRLERDGQPIEAGKSYVVAGWASVNEGTEGPPVYDLVARYVERERTVKLRQRLGVRIVGADPRGIAP